MKTSIEQVLDAVETPNQRASINQTNFTPALAQARAEHAALCELERVAKEFVARCERGEVRSVKSRAAFTQALVALAAARESGVAK